MNALITLYVAVIAAGPAASPAPETCRQITDEAVEIVRGGVEILAAEVRKQQDADPQAGHVALEAYLHEKRPAVGQLRKRAAEMVLAEKQTKQCEDYAYRAFLKMLNRISSVTGFYYNRLDTLRLIGDLFI